MLDLDGVIQDVTLSNGISGEAVDDWRGRPWVDTVGDSVSGKVARMLADARDSGVSAFRQVNQRFPSGLEVPMEYTTVRLGGKAGMIAIGRNLNAVAELQSRLIAAQQAMEQEYWKLREVETRYRMLFDASNEAVLLLKADTLRILEANPAAIRALGLARGTGPAAGNGRRKSASRSRRCCSASGNPAGRPACCCISVPTAPAGWFVPR